MVDRRGIPVTIMLTGANVHDSTVFEELVDSVEPIKWASPGKTDTLKWGR